ncbi:regulator of microtubule dynamics protein 1 isoform 1-T1 [Synchiropus picturatus]
MTMAGLILTRSISRASLPFSGPVRMKGASRCSWTTVSRSRSAQISRRVTLLLGFPAVSCLAIGAYHQVQSSPVLHALEKDDILEQADYLFSCAETEKLYQLLLQCKNSDNVEFLWRLARACRDLAMLPDTEATRKKELVYEGFQYAKKALEMDDKCWAAHKWYGVCLSDIGEYEGIKVKLGNAYIIKEHLERAVELNPKDATSLYILGYWCFVFAGLPWYQRKVAAVIFATPPESTYEEALDFFLQAEDVDPNFYSKNLLMLGKTYLAMKDMTKALHWLTKAREYPAHSHEDKEVHKEAGELLKNFK